MNNHLAVYDPENGDEYPERQENKMEKESPVENIVLKGLIRGLKTC